MNVKTKTKAINKVINTISTSGSTSVNIPALLVQLRSKNIDSEVETLRRSLKNGDEATLIPTISLMQDDGESGSHRLFQVCAINRNDATEVPCSDYPKYDSVLAEWVVTSGNTYEQALPQSDYGFTLGPELVTSNPKFFVTVTLIANDNGNK